MAEHIDTVMAITGSLFFILIALVGYFGKTLYNSNRELSNKYLELDKRVEKESAEAKALAVEEVRKLRAEIVEDMRQIRLEISGMKTNYLDRFSEQKDLSNKHHEELLVHFTDIKGIVNAQKVYCQTVQDLKVPNKIRGVKK